MQLSKAIQSLRIVGYEIKEDINWLGLAKILKINTNPKTVQFEVSNCIRAKKHIHNLEHNTVSKTLQKKIKVRKAVVKSSNCNKGLRKKKENPEDAYIKSDAFLKGQPWRVLRLKVRQHYKDICMKCLAKGGITGWDEEGVILHVDHIVPRKLAPHLALDFDNLQILCASCNKEKGNKNKIDYRKDKFLRESDEEKADKEILRELKKFL